MEIRGLTWDAEDDPDGNVQHIQKHGVTQWDVRDVLESAPVFKRARRESGPNPVYVAIGYTSAGRLLEVWGIHFQDPPHESYWRTITAMDARRPYRDAYFREKGG